MSDLFEGTQIGADGNRYPAGSVPEFTEDEVLAAKGRNIRVYGEPGAGKVIKYVDGQPTWADPEGGGGEGGEPIVATTFTVEEGTDPITEGPMSVVTLSEASTALAIKIDGDAHPRLLILGDPADGIYFGDGTSDPYNNGGRLGLAGDEIVLYANGNVRVNNEGEFRVESDDGMHLFGDAKFSTSDIGPVLNAPDTTNYRLVVGNDGTLATVLVP